jgi:sulfur carrier protein ThiS
VTRVLVTLKGTLADRLPGGRAEVDVPEPATVAALTEVLGLPPRACIVVVNGAAADPGTPLADGDRIQVFPPMAGG